MLNTLINYRNHWPNSHPDQQSKKDIFNSSYKQVTTETTTTEIESQKLTVQLITVFTLRNIF